MGGSRSRYPKISAIALEFETRVGSAAYPGFFRVETLGVGIGIEYRTFSKSAIHHPIELSLTDWRGCSGAYGRLIRTEYETYHPWRYASYGGMAAHDN